MPGFIEIEARHLSFDQPDGMAVLCAPSKPVGWRDAQYIRNKLLRLRQQQQKNTALRMSHLGQNDSQ
jgi:hypothetical protein